MLYEFNTFYVIFASHLSGCDFKARGGPADLGCDGCTEEEVGGEIDGDLQQDRLCARSCHAVCGWSVLLGTQSPRQTPGHGGQLAGLLLWGGALGEYGHRAEQAAVCTGMMVLV